MRLKQNRNRVSPWPSTAEEAGTRTSVSTATFGSESNIASDNTNHPPETRRLVELRGRIAYRIGRCELMDHAERSQLAEDLLDSDPADLHLATLLQSFHHRFRRLAVDSHPIAALLVKIMERAAGSEADHFPWREDLRVVVQSSWDLPENILVPFRGLVATSRASTRLAHADVTHLLRPIYDWVIGSADELGTIDQEFKRIIGEAERAPHGHPH